MATPHDALFQFTFGQPEHAAELLRGALPLALAEAIDWRSLVRCDAKLGDGLSDSLEADLLFTADFAGKPAFLCILVEHKSTDDPLTAYQLLRYVVRVWERYRQDHPTSTRLPPVLPFVLHHGAAPWQSPRRLRDVIDVTGLPRHLAHALLRRQPDLAFELDDLATYSEEALVARVQAVLPRLALLCMQYLRGASPTAATAALERWFDLLRDLFTAPHRQDAFLAIVCYIARVAALEPFELRPVFARIHERAEMVLIQNMRQFEREALERGLAEGRDEGRSEGRSEGRAEGRADGQADLLQRLLQVRFGELPSDIVARIRSGSAADVARWAERLLTAATLDAVFA